MLMLNEYIPVIHEQKRSFWSDLLEQWPVAVFVGAVLGIWLFIYFGGRS